MSRKSCRRRTLTAKVKELHEEKTNQAATPQEHAAKRRKTSPVLPTAPVELAKARAASAPSERPKEDKIDPVEKLLSMTYASGDILLQMDEAETLQASSSASPEPHQNLSYNFNKVIHENMRKYYQTFGKLHIEIHNDNLSFSVLTRPKTEVPTPLPVSRAQVPFFKNVNFGRSPTMGNRLDDYIYCDDDELSATDSEHEDMPLGGPVHVPLPPVGKMSFHYRQNDNLNLSTDTHGEAHGPQDVSKFMNQRSVMSGKASEMVGTSSFMIKDFFF